MNEPSSKPNGKRWTANIWSVLLGQFIMFMFWLFGYIFTQGIRQQQQTEFGQRLSTVEVQIQKINADGTNYSHWQLSPRMQDNTDRLKALELKLNKYDVVVEKVDRLEGEIKELKLRK